MKIKGFKVPIAVLLLGVMLFCTGCGGSGKNEYVTAGMNSIEDLDYDKALESFEQATVNGENERLIYRGQGIAYLGQTEYTKAIEAFENALAAGGTIPASIDYDINYYLAIAYYKAGRLQDAKNVYDAILSLKTKEMDAYYLRGCIEIELGDYNSASADFDAAIALAPENYNQLISICQKLVEYGYQEAADVYLNAALENAPKNIDHFDRGRIYFYLGDYDSARNYLEQSRDAGDAQAAYYLGKTWEALGEYNYAVSVYSSYIKEQGESALIYNQLAMCEMQLEEYEAALSDVQAGLALDNNELKQTLLFNQFAIYEYMGDYKKAAALCSSYLRTYPDDETAAREYEFLKSR